MVSIEKKSTETLKAQVAAFAESLSDLNSRDHIVRNLSGIALGEPQVINRPASFEEFATFHYELNEDADSDGQKQALIVEAATPASYANFLRTDDGREAVAEREALIDNYDEFASALAPFKEELLSGRTPNSRTISFESGASDQRYVAHSPLDLVDATQINVEPYIAANKLAKKNPHLAEIVAASYENGIIISEQLPGERVRYLSVEQMKAITQDQLVDLARTLREMYEAGVEPVRGLVYDEKEGFGVPLFETIPASEIPSAYDGDPLGSAMSNLEAVSNVGINSHSGAYERHLTAINYIEALKVVLEDEPGARNDAIKRIRLFDHN